MVLDPTLLPAIHAAVDGKPGQAERQVKPNAKYTVPGQAQRQVRL